MDSQTTMPPGGETKHLHMKCQHLVNTLERNLILMVWTSSFPIDKNTKTKITGAMKVLLNGKQSLLVKLRVPYGNPIAQTSFSKAKELHLNSAVRTWRTGKDPNCSPSLFLTEFMKVEQSADTYRWT